MPNGLFHAIHDMRPYLDTLLEAYMDIMTCMHAQRVSRTCPEVSRIGPNLYIQA